MTARRHYTFAELGRILRTWGPTLDAAALDDKMRTATGDGAMWLLAAILEKSTTVRVNCPHGKAPRATSPIADGLLAVFKKQSQHDIARAAQERKSASQLRASMFGGWCVDPHGLIDGERQRP